MGIDFADYDNDGRPDIVVTDLSNERYRLFHQDGDGTFPDATRELGRRRGDARVLGLEHALRRLRQRRLEGSVRRAGARAGHDRADVSQPQVPAAAAAAPQRAGPLRAGGAGDGLRSTTGPAAAPRSATSTTTATSTSSSATWASARSCSATTAAIGTTGSRSGRSARGRTATASAPGEGGLGGRADAVLHGHDGRRLPVGQRQAPAGRPRRGPPRRASSRSAGRPGPSRRCATCRPDRLVEAMEPAR